MSKTIDLVAQVFSLFSIDKEEISIREVSNILGIYPSRVHRVLSSLECCGFLEKGLNRKYRLGEGIFEVGVLYPAHLPLRKIARPHAEELAKMFKANVHLAIPSRKNPHSAIIIDRIFNLESSSLIHRFSYNVPLHCSAVGKSILAFLPREKRAEILHGIKLIRYTKNTVIDLKLLKAELDQIRKRGFSTDYGELHENLCCVASPIFQNQQMVGSLSLSDTKERINDRNLNEIAGALKQKTVFISRQL